MEPTPLIMNLDGIDEDFKALDPTLASLQANMRTVRGLICILHNDLLEVDGQIDQIRNKLSTARRDWKALKENCGPKDVQESLMQEPPIADIHKNQLPTIARKLRLQTELLNPQSSLIQDPKDRNEMEIEREDLKKNKGPPMGEFKTSASLKRPKECQVFTLGHMPTPKSEYEGEKTEVESEEMKKKRKLSTEQSKMPPPTQKSILRQTPAIRTICRTPAEASALPKLSKEYTFKVPQMRETSDGRLERIDAPSMSYLPPTHTRPRISGPATTANGEMIDQGFIRPSQIAIKEAKAVGEASKETTRSAAGKDMKKKRKIGDREQKDDRDEEGDKDQMPTAQRRGN